MENDSYYCPSWACNPQPILYNYYPEWQAI